MASENLLMGMVTAAITLSSSAVALYVRLELEKTKSAIITHINTAYVRKETCILRERSMRELLEGHKSDTMLGRKGHGKEETDVV